MLQPAYKELHQYEPVDMLSIFGGLQLVPCNVHHTLRLEAYAFVAASLPNDRDTSVLGRDRLRSFMEDDCLHASGIHQSEDVSSNLFTESVTFRGGGYIIFPGIATSPHCMLKNLATALFLYPHPFPDKAFVTQAEYIIGAALAISDAVATRAGLVRWMGLPEPDSGVLVPDDSRLAELKASVRWQVTDARAELRRRGLPFSALTSLVVATSEVKIDEWDVERNLLSRWPIVGTEDELIVAAPGSLVIAAVNAVLDLADQRQVLPALAERFNSATWDSAAVSLSHMDLPSPQELPLQHTMTCVRDGVLPFDSDKAMHILVVTDPLDSYKPWRQHAMIDRDIAQQIDARVIEVEKWLAHSSEGKLNDFMHVVVFQGLSRDEMYAFSDDTQPLSLGIHLTADDLDIIATKEAGNPLALWKFAKARQRLRDRTEVLCFDIADEYALYVQRGYGFYVGDDNRPTMLFMQPGLAAQLRHELQQKHDRHAVISYDGQHVFEVRRLHLSGNVPIYFPLHDIHNRASILLEGNPLPVWVLSPLYANEATAQQNSTHARIVDSIAYWLWQLSPAITAALEVLATEHQQFTCVVELAQTEERETGSSPPHSNRTCTVNARREDGTLVLSVLAGLEPSLMTDDNAGERALIAEMLQGLRQLLPNDDQELLSEQLVASALDKYAPLGPKKKFFVLDAVANPSLHPGSGLPDDRDIQEADQEAVLDDLGDAMIESGWPVGPVEPDQRDEFLQQAVGYLFARFAKLFATLSPRALPEYLLAQHERLTREWAFLQLTVPTRIACFGDEAEVLEELHTRLPRASHQRLSLRFLIEYAAACPPQGFRQMSLSVYDELMALAAEIVNLGSLSDLCHFQIEDMHWTMLPSGRIGRGIAAYAAKRKGYLESHAVGQVHRAHRSFARFWCNHEREAGEVEDRIDAAMVAELGVPFTAIMDVLGVAMSFGLKNKDVFSLCREQDFIDLAMTQTGLSEHVVRTVLKMLVLEPRSAFLSPDGFRREDTYPWRLDRALSYVRRPFVVRVDEEGNQLLWGFRHIDQAARYWIDAWLYGRLQAKSHEMKKLVSLLHNERGNDFNDEVAAAFEKYPGLIVKKKVKRIDRRLLPGDIDVLIAIPTHRKLKLIECKDLEPARMPNEINSELMKLFKGKSGKPSAIEKHWNRLKWVQQNAEAVLEYMGCNDGGTWKAEALFVTDSELLTPFLRDSPVRFVPIAEISKAL